MIALTRHPVYQAVCKRSTLHASPADEHKARRRRKSIPCRRCTQGGQSPPRSSPSHLLYLYLCRGPSTDADAGQGGSAHALGMVSVEGGVWACRVNAHARRSFYVEYIDHWEKLDHQREIQAWTCEDKYQRTSPCISRVCHFKSAHPVPVNVHSVSGQLNLEQFHVNILELSEEQQEFKDLKRNKVSCIMSLVSKDILSLSSVNGIMSKV